MSQLVRHLLMGCLLTAGGCGAQVVLLGAEKGRLFTADDVLALPGEPVELRVRFQSGDLLADRAGHVVHFGLGGRLYRAAETDDEGVATVTFAPPTPGQYVFTASFSPNGFAEEPPSPVQLRVACLSAEAPIMIVDLDKTLVASGFEQVLIGDPAPMPGSPAAMKRFAQRYRVVYLTHRPYYFGAKSKAWLTRYGYPPGPVLLSDVKGFLKGSEAFKTGVLLALGKRFKQIRIGIGDRPTDAKAYRANGIRAFLILQPDPSAPLEDLKELAEALAELPEDVQVLSTWREIEQAVGGAARYPRSRAEAKLDRLIRDRQSRIGPGRG